MFHEILHYALYIADRKSNNTNFKIRGIVNPKITNLANFWADEGLIEDCGYRLFKDCADQPYLEFVEIWHDNNARRYNRPPDDCIECKLCKKIKNNFNEK